jgi:predicted adenine nucleotide alpha hydrolase (AANH) superfamily ATPase
MDIEEKLNSDDVNEVISMLREAEEASKVYECCLSIAESYVQGRYENMQKWRSIVREVLKTDELSLKTKQCLACFD